MRRAMRFAAVLGTLLAVGQALAYTVGVGTYVCNPGVDVNVAVDLDSAAGLSFVSARISYDPQMLVFREAKVGTLGACMDEDFTVTSEEAGVVTVGLFGSSNVVEAAGSIAVLTFGVRERTERLYSDVTVSDVQLGEMDGVKDVTVGNPLTTVNGMVRIMSEDAAVDRLENGQVICAGTRLKTLSLKPGDGIAVSEDQPEVSVAGAVTTSGEIPMVPPEAGWRSGEYRLLATSTGGLPLRLTGLAEDDSYTIYEKTENGLVVYMASVLVQSVPTLTIGESVNAPSLEWTTGGAADWTGEVSVEAKDGIHAARSGEIGDDTNVWMQTTLRGYGTLSFAWRCSCEERSDMLHVVVDDVVKGMISGETPWTDNAIEILGEGEHVVRWVYRKGRSGSAGADAAWVDCVAWVSSDPGELTLARALNENLYWLTDGDAPWTPRAEGDAAHPIFAEIRGLDDNQSARVWTYVYGSGTLSFDWAGNIEEWYDWLNFYVDGDCKEAITGGQGWSTVSLKLGEGKHLLEWEFWKDEKDGLDHDDYCALLDNVAWMPSNLENAVQTEEANGVASVSFVWLKGYPRYLDSVGGDYEAAARLIGRNGYPLWQSYVAGLDPENDESVFKSYIELKDGIPEITWHPDLGAVRKYTILGKKTLVEKDWMPVDAGDQKKFNFFKVKVELK